jgi:hypothetical protein
MIQVIKVDSFAFECAILYFNPQQSGSQDIKEYPEEGSGNDQKHGKRKWCVPAFNSIGKAVDDVFLSLFRIFAVKMGVTERQPEYDHKNEGWKYIQHDVLKVQQVEMSHAVFLLILLFALI